MDTQKEANQWYEIECLAKLYDSTKENDPSVTLAYDLVAEERLKVYIKEIESHYFKQ